MPPKLKYSEEQMSLAINAVKQGMPVSTAAKTFKVPRTTLLDKKSGRTPIYRKMGPPSILSLLEEEILVNWIFLMTQKHQPVTKEQVLDSVQLIIKQEKRKSPFTDGRPGKKWFTSFLKRNPQVTSRIAQNLTPARESVTEEKIRRWFREIHEYLRSENLLDVSKDPTRVFNADESAFFLQPKGEKVLAKKGEKSVYIAGTNDDKENLTVLVTANGQGDFAPPMIIFKYERIPAHIAAGVNKEWGLGRSETGWMCGSTFFEYITNVFVPWLDKNRVKRPILLFIDGHVSHMTYNLSHYCKQNKIEVIALYPNSTHLIQPMDVAVFKPLKTYWKKAVRQFHIDNDGAKLRKEHFSMIFESALTSVSKETIQNGFKACGLVPFCADNVNFSKMSFTNAMEKFDNVKLKQKLQILEDLIPRDKLNVFKSRNMEEWNGDVEDTSLYTIWKTLKIRTNENAERPKEYSKKQEPGTGKIIIHSVQILPSKSCTSLMAQEINSHTPLKENSTDSATISNTIEEKQTPQIGKPGCSNSSPCTPFSKFKENVPTPFKKALFWPTEVKTEKKRRSKEKIPSAITSQAWQDYHKGKEMEKQKKREEKENRAKIREAKKKTKLQLEKKPVGKRRRVSSDSSDTDMEWQESGDSLDDVSEIGAPDNEEQDQEIEIKGYKIGDFLLVRFLGGNRKTTQYRYVCVVQNIFNESEIEVTSLKCLHENKMIYKMVDNDVSVIKEEDILQKLPEPQVQNVGDRLKYVFPKSVNVYEC